MGFFTQEENVLTGLEALKKAQERDRWCKRVTLRLATDPTGRAAQRFEIREGVLYKTGEANKKARMVIQDNLKADALRRCHGLAHLGRNNTIRALTRNMWWDGSQRDTRRWIQACQSCCKRKTTRPMTHGLPQSMSASRPSHTWAIDILSPFPETPEGYNCVLTMIDVFTRWTIAVPLQNHNAQTVGNALYKHLICEHGCPTRILSDRGKEFLDKGVKQMCRRWGINKIETSGLNPQANGHVERVHRYLNAALTMAYNRAKNDWDYHLPGILFAYRCSVSEATGHSPFYMMYGRDPVSPVERAFELDDSHEVYSGDREWVKVLCAGLQSAYTTALKQQLENDERSILRRTNRRVQVKYGNDDKVYLWEDVTPLMVD
jgi:transposase InsO family protein